jgi:hypothetical protein
MLSSNTRYYELANFAKVEVLNGLTVKEPTIYCTLTHVSQTLTSNNQIPPISIFLKSGRAVSSASVQQGGMKKTFSRDYIRLLLKC